MLRHRIIPCLQLLDDSLVKTVQFDKPAYIGDPINTVRIFNELEVDELCFLDIRATVQNKEPNIALLKQIADECFMPMSYGGGIKTFDTAKNILSIGFEKLVINSAAYNNPELIKKLSEYFGAQSLIGSIDVKKNIWGKYQVYIHDGTKKVSVDVIEWANKLEELGVGELLVTAMDKDGTWSGYDLEIIKKISSAVKVPVIANGGAGELGHIKDAINKTEASAVGLGSMVVYQKKGMGVLINFPETLKVNLSA